MTRGRSCSHAAERSAGRSRLSALVARSGRLGGGKLVRLVVDLGGDGAQALFVLLAVVGTEEELAAGGEGDAEVGLRAAAVTAVERGELGGGEEVWCQDSGHVAPSFCVDCARGPAILCGSPGPVRRSGR